MATFSKTLPDEKSAVAEPNPKVSWSPVVWFAILLAVCYAPVLTFLVKQWAESEDMGHGFFVPIVAGFIVWQRRAALAAIKPVTNYWGLAIVLVGALFMVVGTLGAQIFIARVAFLVSLAGIVLFLGGTRMMKAVAFPLFLLLVMIPIPSMIYARVTLPLQLFASAVAENILGLLGIPVLRDGNVLELASQRLSVVEACSGIRSLLSLSFLSLVYGYFFDRKAWMRWVLLAATIPIAIAANATRVTLTGLISEYRTDLAEGFFHTVEGLVLFGVSLALLVAFHQTVNRIYLTRHPQEPAPHAAA
jgi:exosortase